jgi:hypothetical protein
VTEDFQLTNDKPRPAPLRFENEECRQTVLFAGMDCLAGQQDLFEEFPEQEESR